MNLAEKEIQTIEDAVRVIFKHGETEIAIGETDINHNEVGFRVGPSHVVRLDDVDLAQRIDLFVCSLILESSKANAAKAGK
jgi:hypothetical protein